MTAVGWGESLRVWLRVASLSFGGPAGQIAVMHRIVVDEKRWVEEGRFLHALSFCTLLPGPEAQQLATYLGWLTRGTGGAVLAGGLFVLPGLLSIMALSWMYALYGRVGPLAAVFFGLKAAVLAVVLQALLRLSRRALGAPGLGWLALGAFVLLFALSAPFPMVMIGAGLLGWALQARWGNAASDVGEPAVRRPGTIVAACIAAGLWLVPVALIVLVLGAGSTFGEIAVFFSKMAVIGFGGAYAVLAYVAQAGVDQFGWLRPGEMLDGLGLAETTPGPLIMVVQFVGFMAAFRGAQGLPPLLAGTLGGLLTSWVTFAPCFVWIFLGAPYIDGLRRNRALAGALAAITAAVVGVILNLAVWFALHFWFLQQVRVPGLGIELPVLASADWAALALSAAALVAVFRFGSGLLPVLAGCALAGLALHGAGIGQAR